MKNNMEKETVVVGLLVLFFFLGVMLSTARQVRAGLTSIPGMSYKVNATMGDNLKALAGKRVDVTLDSGTVLTGTVKTVGKSLLHLEKLESKEYFDALIRIDRISAIDARFRDYKH